jgi:hypothetical protein
VDYGNVTMPAYGGNIGLTYTVAPVRPWLVLYCVGAVQGVTLNGGGGSPFAGDTFTMQIGPPVASLSSNIFWTITQVFSWALPLTTNSFAFTVTVGGNTYTLTTQTVGNPSIPHVYEGFLFASST